MAGIEGRRLEPEADLAVLKVDQAGNSRPVMGVRDCGAEPSEVYRVLFDRGGSRRHPQ